MTDPDAPSREDPKWSEFCHWIVTDVLVTKPCKCDISRKDKQKDVISYRPPSPPEKTGFHRYVFLAFESNNGTSKKLHLTKPADRKRWGTGKKRHGVRDWAEKNDLTPVGKCESLPASPVKLIYRTRSQFHLCSKRKAELRGLGCVDY
jgi:phosphatidylethanolamine-binding protein (PEBP) family uncharacterized protein